MLRKRKNDECNKSYFIKPEISEAFFTLRTNIDKGVRSIVITSYKEGEGKSTIAANLAVAMATTEQKVLLVDGDLRKPIVHEIFCLENVGLTNILAEDDLDRGIQHNPKYPNLDIVCSGPVPINPADLLSSSKMTAFLEKMKERYDTIIIDSPPLKLVSDAAILSDLADETMIVCRENVTKKEELEEAKEILYKANSKNIGVVVNNIRSKLYRNRVFDFGGGIGR